MIPFPRQRVGETDQMFFDRTYEKWRNEVIASLFEKEKDDRKDKSGATPDNRSFGPSAAQSVVASSNQPDSGPRWNSYAARRPDTPPPADAGANAFEPSPLMVFPCGCEFGRSTPHCQPHNGPVDANQFPRESGIQVIVTPPTPPKMDNNPSYYNSVKGEPENRYAEALPRYFGARDYFDGFEVVTKTVELLFADPLDPMVQARLPYINPFILDDYIQSGEVDEKGRYKIRIR